MTVNSIGLKSQVVSKAWHGVCQWRWHFQRKSHHGLSNLWIDQSLDRLAMSLNCWMVLKSKKHITCLWMLYLAFTASPLRAYPDQCSMIWEGFGPTGTTKEIQKEWVRFPRLLHPDEGIKMRSAEADQVQVISRASLFPLWLAWADVHTGFSFSQADTKSAKTPSQTSGRLCILVLPCPFPWQAMGSYWVANKKNPCTSSHTSSQWPRPWDLKSVTSSKTRPTSSWKAEIKTIQSASWPENS